MNCEQGMSLISARMDGEILPEDRHRLSAHLSECASCRIAVDEWERDDRDLVRAFGERQRRASAVADRALEAWLEEAPSPWRRWKLWRLSTAAAAGFALAFLLFGLLARVEPGGTDLTERAHALVEEWKRSPGSYDAELRLRSMGPACVAPLADAVQDWDGEPTDMQRLAAVRVLCDLAGAPQIPTLIDLLGDSSPEIRSLSEASLIRLTGRGRVDPVVALEPLGPAGPQAATCSNPQVEWREWWAANSARFNQSIR